MNSYLSTEHKQLTISDMLKMKENKQKIAMLTCYDASFCCVLNQANVDIILIGDSLGNVIQGHTSTIPVSINDMMYHTQNIARSNTRSFIIADMPFASYANPHNAYNNASKLIQTGAHMIKLEGGKWVEPVVEYLSTRGIPVCAHLGLTPQYIHKLGGFKKQATEISEATQLVSDAKILQNAGAQIMLCECIPELLMKEVTQELTIPTIGIGAGKYADGQVLVLYDILGISMGRIPKFSKLYLDGEENKTIQQAINSYVDEVKNGIFPL